jgi:hypothetical protein
MRRYPESTCHREAVCSLRRNYRDHGQASKRRAGELLREMERTTVAGSKACDGGTFSGVNA